MDSVDESASRNGLVAERPRHIIPNVIFSLATESIGTSKLRLIMERHAKAKGATIQRLLDVFLAIDLRLPHWIEQCDALLRSCRKNQSVSELIFTKLFQIFMVLMRCPCRYWKTSAAARARLALAG